MKTQTINPSDAVIVGLDTDDGEEHPLYDPRINKPLRNSFIRNIAQYGVLEAPRLTTDAEGRLLVVSGRQRIRAARKVNEKRAKTKDPLLMVRCVISDDDSSTGAIHNTASNEARTNNTPIERARLCYKHSEEDGMSQQKLADLFDVSTKQVKNWLDLMALATPETLDACEFGIKDPDGKVYMTTDADGKSVPVVLTLTEALQIVRVAREGTKGRNVVYDPIPPEVQQQQVAAYIRRKARKAEKGVKGERAKKSERLGRKVLLAFTDALMQQEGWQYYEKANAARKLLRAAMPDNKFAAGILFALDMLDLDQLLIEPEERKAFFSLLDSCKRASTRKKVAGLMAKKEADEKAKAVETVTGKGQKKSAPDNSAAATAAKREKAEKAKG